MAIHSLPSDRAQRIASEHLKGMPPEVRSAYLTFAETGDGDALDRTLFGVLEFYLPQPPAQPLSTLPGDAKLMADVGIDSLSMVEAVFLLETLFDVRISEEELAQIVTLQDMKSFVRQKLATAAP